MTSAPRRGGKHSALVAELRSRARPEDLQDLLEDLRTHGYALLDADGHRIAPPPRDDR